MKKILCFLGIHKIVAINQLLTVTECHCVNCKKNFLYSPYVGLIDDTNKILQSTPNAPVSDTTEADSSNADGNKKVSELREKFFNECITEHGSGYAFVKSPNDIFEWFKPYLQGTIDWEGLEDVIEDAYNKSTMPTEGGYGADTTSLSELQKHLINLLKTKLQDYIK